MAGLQPRSCNASMASILQHPCLFTARPSVPYRLQYHSRLNARQRCQRVRNAFSSPSGDFEFHTPTSHSTRCTSSKGKDCHAQGHSFVAPVSLVDRIVGALKQIGLAALVMLFGLSTAMTAHARYAVITALQQSTGNTLLKSGLLAVAYPCPQILLQNRCHKTPCGTARQYLQKLGSLSLLILDGHVTLESS